MSGGTRSYEIARRLVEKGHEVYMITTYRSPTRKKKWFVQTIDGIQVNWLPVPYSNKMKYYERIKAFAHFAIKAGNRAISIGGDIIFATSTPLTIAIPAIQIKKRLKIPMVFEVRDMWPEVPICIEEIKNPIVISTALLLERFAYSNSDFIVALSYGMLDSIVSSGYPREKVKVIPNCSDIELFNKVDGKRSFRLNILGLKNNPLITYAGTLGSINGVGYLVDIAVAAKKIAPELRFLVVGDGKEKEMIRKRAESAGILGDSFFLLPSVSKAEMPKVLEGSDVGISLFVDHKSMWDNSANKFFDYLAAGKPVVINYGGWQDEVLRASGAGIRIPSNDSMVSARMLSEWIANKKNIRNSGMAAKRLALLCYNRDKLAIDFEEVLISTHKKYNAER